MNKTAQTPVNKVQKLLQFLKGLFIAKAVLYVIIALAIFVIINPKRVSEFIKGGDDEEVQTEELPETGDSREILKVSSPVADSNDSTDTIPVVEENLVYGLTIDADIVLPESNSLARVVLIDTGDNEYLVHESYPLLEGAESLSVTDICEETCLLNGITVKELRVDTEDNALIDITSINKNTTKIEGVTEEERNERRETLLAEKVEKLNEEIKENDLKWKAGVTSFSRLTFAQKMEIFDGKVPNFQGLEFYKGGVFEIKDEGTVEEFELFTPKASSTSKSFVEDVISKLKGFVINEESEPSPASNEFGEVKAAYASSIYVDSWDWREVHGADDPNSFYYDGDGDSLETGNGWMTEVKDQASCGSCWAFAVTGATEALTNLYFNRHLDLDLAEQDALSCSGAGSCSGGWPSVTIDYYTTTGVVEEDCFPYTATNQSCSNKCSNPDQRIKLSGRVPFTNKTEDNLKGMIIEYGPMSGGIYSWSHAMPLLGWDTDEGGDTYWIFKNSWGKNWGDGGYLYLKTPITNIGWTHALENPIIDSESRTISCLDADGDGYYNWGISENKPATCPGGIPDEKDCDDSDPAVVMSDSKYDCTGLPPDIYFNLNSHRFGRVPIDQETTPVEVVIGNHGEGDLQISDIDILNETYFTINLNPADADDPCGQVDPLIATGDTCSFEVSFNALSVGNYLTKVLVRSSDDVTPNSWLTFSGSGSNEPQGVCAFFGGTWASQPDRCFGILPVDCTDYGGSLFPCDSLCSPGEGCTHKCVESCRY